MTADSEFGWPSQEPMNAGPITDRDAGLREEVARLRGWLREATEAEWSEPCRLDHHGSCQNHGYLDGPCLIPTVRDYFALSAPAGNRPAATLEEPMSEPVPRTLREALAAELRSEGFYGTHSDRWNNAEWQANFWDALAGVALDALAAHVAAVVRAHLGLEAP